MFRGTDLEFIRSPLIENQVLFLKSKCNSCGFTILASSVEDLLEQEERHRTECAPLRRAA